MTIETMAKNEPETTPASAVVDQKVVAELVARASAEGVRLRVKIFEAEVSGIH